MALVKKESDKAEFDCSGIHCVTLGKLHNFSGPQFPCVNGVNCTYFTGLLTEIK